MRGRCSSHYTLLLPNTSCSKTRCWSRDRKPSKQTRSKCLQKQHGRGPVCKTQRKEKRRPGERRREEIWLRVVPRLRTPGGPRWWWWTRLALHRSDAWLLFAPLLASLPRPLPASSHPFLTLLPEFYSNPQRDHRPPAPVTKEEGKFQPVLSAAAGGAGGEGGVHGRLLTASEGDRVRTSFPLSNTNTSAALF